MDAESTTVESARIPVIFSHSTTGYSSVVFCVFFDPSLPLMPGNVLWFLSELVSSERTTTEVTMPQRDGTGRQGQGPGMGGGVGQGGAGRGQGGGSSKGPGGNCICPSCGERVPHQLGTPCFEEKCPKCGTQMARE